MAPRHPALFVSWRSQWNRTIHHVGRLVYRDDLGLYEFVYIGRAVEAVRQGFLPFLEFPDLYGIYLSPTLFPLFANRILPRNRPDFEAYIGALGLFAESADPMNILARTGGRRETDQIELFPLPLPDKDTGAYSTYCLIRGIQHMPQPSVDERIARLEPGEPLLLLGDVQNEVDPTAIAVRARDCVLLGYLPAYLTRDVWRIIDASPQCRVVVAKVNLPPAGVHHRLLCRVEGRWPRGFIPFNTDDYRPLHPEATDLSEWIETPIDRSADQTDSASGRDKAVTPHRS